MRRSEDEPACNECAAAKWLGVHAGGVARRVRSRHLNKAYGLSIIAVRIDRSAADDVLGRATTRLLLVGAGLVLAILVILAIPVVGVDRAARPIGVAEHTDAMSILRIRRLFFLEIA